MGKKFVVTYGGESGYTDEDILLCAKGLGYGMPMNAIQNETPLQYSMRKLKDLNTEWMSKGKAMEYKKPLVTQVKQTEQAIATGVAATIDVKIEEVA